MRFYHERLQVYEKALQAFVLADEASLKVPARWGSLGDQLRRAALSVGANIAEGASEFAEAEQKRFYRMAKRSACECAFFTAAMRRSKWADEAQTAELDQLLYEIVCMLTAMIRKERPRP